jgi:single-stranded DNA-binding protein
MESNQTRKEKQMTFNKFMLIGEVGVGPEDRATVECSEVGPNRVYTEHLTCTLPPKFDLKPGRHKIEGTLTTVYLEDGTPRTIIAADKLSKVKKAEKGMNVGRIVGTMYQSFDLLDSNPGRRTMGWGLVQIGEELFRFVAFSGLAHRLANGNSKMPAAKKGAEVQVQGRLRIREYESNGEIRKMVEIVADPDWTLVKKAAEMVDIFADDMAGEGTDDKAEAI